MIEEFKAAEDKVEYFRNLSNSDKKELWKSFTSEEERKEFWHELSSSDKKSVFSWLSIEDIRSFLSTISVDEKKDLYELFDRNKLRGYYKSLSEEEKKQMAYLLGDQALELLTTKENLNQQIIDSRKSMVDSHENIAKASESIANNQANIANTNLEIKQNNVLLKKATKEEKKRLRKLLRAAKPSIFDKIGFISKIRSRKLAEATDIYLAAKSEVDKYQEIDVNLKGKVDEYEKEIEKANKEIAENQENIKKQTMNIKTAAGEIKKVNVTIKKLNKAEKKILGRKLHGKQVDARNRVMVTNRTKGKDLTGARVTETREEAPRVVEQPRLEVSETKEDEEMVILDEKVAEHTKPKTPQNASGNGASGNNAASGNDNKNNTEEQIKQTVDNMNQIVQSGVSFFPPRPVNGQTIDLGNSADKNAICSIDMKTLLIICSAAAIAYSYMMQQQEEMKKQQEEQQGYTRTHSKGNVSLGLLVFIITLLLAIMFLFF